MQVRYTPTNTTAVVIHSSTTQGRGLPVSYQCEAVTKEGQKKLQQHRKSSDTQLQQVAREINVAEQTSACGSI